MKKLFIIIFLTLLAFTSVAQAAGPSIKIVGRKVIVNGLTDWNIPNGETLLKVFTPKLMRTGDNLVIWCRQANGLGNIRVLVLTNKRWNLLVQSTDRPIYKLEIGDVNEDGIDELVVGLRQRSKLDVEIKKRIYVYSIDPVKHVFIPLWWGSALSRPFEDFTLLKSDKRSNLTAIETQVDHPEFKWLSLYTWDSFGFHKIWDTPIMGTITNWGKNTGLNGRQTLFIQRIYQYRKDTIEFTPDPQKSLIAHQKSSELLK